MTLWHWHFRNWQINDKLLNKSFAPFHDWSEICQYSSSNEISNQSGSSMFPICRRSKFRSFLILIINCSVGMNLHDCHWQALFLEGCLTLNTFQICKIMSITWSSVFPIAQLICASRSNSSGKWSHFKYPFSLDISCWESTGCWTSQTCTEYFAVTRVTMQYMYHWSNLRQSYVDLMLRTINT